jgi:hypothetical protein
MQYVRLAELILVLLIAWFAVALVRSGWAPPTERAEDTWLKSKNNRHLILRVLGVLAFATAVVVANRCG